MQTTMTTRGELRNAKHVAGLHFVCGDCGQTKPVHTEGGTGYGYLEEGDKAKPVCYACCGKREEASMKETGKAVLYFTPDKGGNGCKVTNWPGTLELRGGYTKGRHNIARWRYDVWFVFDGWQWHGTVYGNNTQICRCKRTKVKA